MPDSLARTRADELNEIGAELHIKKHQIELARMHYLAALNVDPNHASALQNLGAALIVQEKYDTAAAVSTRAVEVAPDNLGAWGNLGVAYTGMREYDKAIEIFERILPKIPRQNSAPIRHNYGLANHMLERFDKAIGIYEESLSISPGVNAVLSDRGLAILATGDLTKGLEAYECRWRFLSKSPIWKLKIIEWKGQVLEGKKLLLHHEQGLGDSIMLCRFIKDLIALGAKLTVAVPVELMVLVKKSFPEVNVVDWESKDIKAEDFDYHSPMLSALRWLRKTPKTISPEPYLFADKWKDIGVTRLPKAFRVGICWSSGNHGPYLAKRRRYVNPKLFLPLTILPGVKLISLQKGDDVEHDLARIGAEGWIFDCMARMDDFADTATLVKELDVVISVDSAIIHLAGGLGVKSIMLSPMPRCWRWWNASASHPNGLPWYRDMTFLQQAEDGSWNAAMNRVTEIVSTLAKGISNGNANENR